MGATIHRAIGLYSMADDPTTAVVANGGEGLNGAFETIETMGFTEHSDFKGLIVVITAGFAPGHVAPPVHFSPEDVSHDSLASIRPRPNQWQLTSSGRRNFRASRHHHADARLELPQTPAKLRAWERLETDRVAHRMRRSQNERVRSFDA
jgi:hypothetical protein